MLPSVRYKSRKFSDRPLRFHYATKALVWLWACTSVLSLMPSNARAGMQNGLKTAAIEGIQITSTAHTSPQPPLHRFLNNKVIPDIESSEIREHVVLRAGRAESMTGMLNRFRLPSADKQLWNRAILANFGGQPLPRGEEVHFYFDKATTKEHLKSPAGLTAIELDQSDELSMIWEKTGRAILFQRLEKPYDVEIQSVSAVIENSLAEDGQKAGIQPALLSQLAQIFTWDLDFERGFGSGDSVKILYEKRTRKGKDAKTYLRILAAELINAGQKFTAIYFEKEKGMSGYYDLDGRSLARNFLRFPVEFVHISSQFAESRFNPILKTYLPHTGVDFAAERGTPVRAVGDGVITQAGWNGQYGKSIDLQHDSRYMSRYAHLGNFARGIRNGVSVKKGQVIGYVGTTGRSTGPHLHFELYKDQQHVNPLRVDFPAEDTIEPSLQRTFDNQKRNYLVELSTAPQT
jgi:murein DD-endopeptidase MepM/ murein hydrolase activator NlpD